MDQSYYRPCTQCCNMQPEQPEAMRHVHEFTGSVRLPEENEEPHNHRFAGITSQAILLPGGNHVHDLEARTDFYEDHFHLIDAQTGPAIPVGGGRHVHFLAAATSINDEHFHGLILSTLIEDPIGD